MAGQDEIWSTCSTGEPERSLRGGFGSHYTDGDHNRQALSKENLRQLRQQLESGDTPLRPELLEGLGDAVRAVMTRPGAMSDQSASLAVEVPDDVSRMETYMSNREGWLYGAKSEKLSSHSPMVLGPSGEVEYNNHSMSFRSTVVEAAQTEAADRRAETGVEASPGSSLHAATDPDEINHSNGEEEEEEREKSITECSRDAHNESLVMGEDEIEREREEEENNRGTEGDLDTLRRRVREMGKLLDEAKNERCRLRKEFRGITAKLDEHQEHTDQLMRSSEARMMGLLEAMGRMQIAFERMTNNVTQRLDEVERRVGVTPEDQKAARASAGPPCTHLTVSTSSPPPLSGESTPKDASTAAVKAASPTQRNSEEEEEEEQESGGVVVAAEGSDRSWVTVALRYPSSTAAGEKEYIVTVPLTATVGACKETLLQYLRRDGLPEEGVNPADLVLTLGATALFDDAVLGTDLYFQPSSPAPTAVAAVGVSSAVTAAYTLTLRLAQTEERPFDDTLRRI